jgi:predicted CXXCH cytochrome family protein
LRNIKKELENKKHLHGPIKEDKCSVCHDPHGSSYPRLLTGPYPSDFYANYKPGIYGFCLGCHEENLLRFPETTVNTEFRNGNKNLHYVHSARKLKGRTCRTCHAPHASDYDKLIAEEGASFGSWNIPIRFVLKDTGGSCSPGCHQTKQYDRVHPVHYGDEKEDKSAKTKEEAATGADEKADKAARTKEEAATGAGEKKGKLEAGTQRVKDQKLENEGLGEKESLGAQEVFDEEPEETGEQKSAKDQP